MASLAIDAKRLRPGITVICVGYRSPSLLAKMASTLDVISNGRLDLGVGAGWAEPEYRAYGFQFDPPAVGIEKMREAVVIIKKMWTEEKTTYWGRYYKVFDAYNSQPLQEPHPPIWIGGGGEKSTLRVVAEVADECNFEGLSVEEYIHKLEVLDTHCARLHRRPDEIRESWQDRVLVADDEAEVRRKLCRFLTTYRDVEGAVSHIIVGTPEQCIRRIGQYIDLGVTQFMLVFPEAPRDLEGLQLFSKEVMPSFS
ncbi:MAG: LLM class flavin-dependent oxidoreductase [Candidatus Bathyarchaeia archaeon]